MPQKKVSDEKAKTLWIWSIPLLVFVWMVFHFGISSGGARATPANLQGQQVYQLYCAGCHDATNLQLVTQPPKLDGLFGKQTLPSGAPATDANVQDVILHGRGIMPPFEQTISSDDVNALVQYLHSK